MNNNIKANVTAATNSVVEKYTNNVIIRMSDFYPEAVGGQEYCMVTKEVYAELLRFKAIEEEAETEIITPENMPTVIIMVTDFYPETKGGEEYREISREEYNNLMAVSMPYVVAYSESGVSYRVKVRTMDFYPFLCSEREFSEIDSKTYHTLMSFKTVGSDNAEDASNEITKEEIKNDGEEDIEEIERVEDIDDISDEIMEEILRYKELENKYKEAAKSDVVRIRISDFYHDPCGDEEYCEVSREVYKQLCRDKRNELSQKRKDRRYIANFSFDELLAGDMYGKYSDPADISYEKMKIINALYRALNELRPTLKKRFYLYYIQGFGLQKIADNENVSHVAVHRSLETARKQLRKLILKYVCD